MEEPQLRQEQKYRRYHPGGTIQKVDLNLCPCSPEFGITGAAGSAEAESD